MNIDSLTQLFSIHDGSPVFRFLVLTFRRRAQSFTCKYLPSSILLHPRRLATACSGWQRVVPVPQATGRWTLSPMQGGLYTTPPDIHMTSSLLTFDPNLQFLAMRSACPPFLPCFSAFLQTFDPGSWDSPGDYSLPPSETVSIIAPRPF